jgi:hypothetical protein
MSEYLVLQHVCSVSHFPASLPLRFQKLNIPCLHLEINHTIERILQCYVAELEFTKKVSTLHGHRGTHSCKEGGSENLRRCHQMPGSSEVSSQNEGSWRMPSESEGPWTARSTSGYC